MTKLRAALLALALLLFGHLADAAPPARVRYTVTVANPARRLLRVRVRAEEVTEPKISFALPAWSPGWYVLSEPERSVAEVAALGPGNRPLTVRADGPRTWEVDTDGAKTVTFEYDLTARDEGLGFFYPYLDSRTGFVPGPMSLAYVVGATDKPCEIRYEVPDGWKIASANDPLSGEPGAYSAPSYDVLADHPAELGAFTRYDRTIAGVPISVVAVGARGPGVARLADRLFRIAEAGIRIFGGAPFPRYQFQLHFSDTPGVFFGGLEHLNATVIRMSTDTADHASLADLRLCAHEFVHAWIVKRVRPEKLGPFDYSRPAAVKDLWLCEGVTDYYSPRLVVEAGLADQGFWLDYLAQNLDELEANPARRTVTLEDASRRVWESGGSTGYGGLSYYNKGMLVGWLLDIELRRRTGNKVGLDDLIKDLLRQAKETGRGFPDGGIEKTASRLAGADLKEFFDRALRSTRALPHVELARAGGIELETRTVSYPTLGVEWDFANVPGGTGRVASFEPDSTGQAAGLKVGDIVLDLDRIARNPPEVGQTLTLQVNRFGETRTVAAKVGKKDETRFRLRPLDSAPPEAAAILATISGAKVRTEPK